MVKWILYFVDCNCYEVQIVASNPRFISPVVLVSKNMKLLISRLITAPCVQINLDHLCVSCDDCAFVHTYL